MKAAATVAALSVLALGLEQARAQVDPAIHEVCLKAADYEGCVKAQTYGISKPERTAEVCDKYDWCLAGKGDDRLGLPKVKGWAYKTVLTGDVVYREVDGDKVTESGTFKPLWYAIPHKGQKRYIGVRSVRHIYDGGALPRPGYTIQSGTRTTTCNSYGGSDVASTSCTTTPPIRTYIPGSPGRLPGIKQDFIVTVTDCVEKTRGTYEVGGGLRGKWKTLSVYEMPEACKAMESLPVLPMEL